MKAPIHSQKHIVQITRSSVVTVSRNTESLINALPIADVNTPVEVTEGAIVKAVYIELWLESSSNNGFEIVTVIKVPESGTGPTFAQMQALNSYTNKKNILFTHQALSANDGVGNPIPVLRQWIKIPKSKQRFGLGDNLMLSISNPSVNTLDYCGFAIFKEYS